VAIRLHSLIGEPLAVATVNLQVPSRDPREIAIKDYSEGEGMLAALIAAGIVEDTGVALASGYVSIPIARLTDAAIAEAKLQGVVVSR
jgi:Asp/Glu/hydantoin racemase